MNFKEAIKMFQQDVAKFEKFYQHGLDTTDYYEYELPEEDWYEQFLVFLQAEGK